MKVEWWLPWRSNWRGDLKRMPIRSDEEPSCISVLFPARGCGLRCCAWSIKTKLPRALKFASKMST